MSKLLLLVLPVVSAVLATLSLPWFDLGFLAWFGLAPLLFALRQTRPLAGAGLGLLFGCTYASGAFYWLGGIAGMTVATTLLMYVSFGSYYLVAGFLYALVSRAIGAWIIVGAPAIWVALEYTRSNLGFLALPWNLLAHSQHGYLPVIQIADVTGVYGISFLIVMVNQVVSQVPEYLTAGRRAPASTSAPLHRPAWAVHLPVVALALVATLSYGWYRLGAPEKGERLRVALVQANVLAREKMSIADQLEHMRAYDELTREAAKSRPDLVVWPSSSLPAPIRSRVVHFYTRRLVYETGTYLLVGGAGGNKFAPRKDRLLPFSNSEFLIAPSGRVERQYNKIRLTPFDEYVPLNGTIPWPRWITTMKDGFVAGSEYTLFQVAGARFGAPVCWENTFPDLFRRFVRDGANFMVSVTNEGFFGPTAGPYQTLAMNVFRAVENRVAIVRAATTGVSGFISPKGEVVARIADGNGKDLFVSGVLVRDVPLSNGKTFYTLYGDVFAHATIGLAALLILASLFSQAVRPAASKAARSEDPERAPAGVP